MKKIIIGLKREQKYELIAFVKKINNTLAF